VIKHFAIGVLVLSALLTVAPQSAFAELPPDRNINYYIRETPTQPSSDILYIVRFELSADSQIGNTISWEMLSTTIIEVGTGNPGDKIWIDDAPAPATSNGFWNVTHDTPSEPLATEFDALPPLAGTAWAEDLNDEDLEYDFENGDCDSTCKQLFSGVVAAITYVLQPAEGYGSNADGTDEPVEVDDDIAES